MEKVIEIIEKIRNTTSTNEKVIILQENYDNDKLRTILNLTYNPYIQFGVKKLPNGLPLEFNFDEFVKIALECAKKEGNLSKRQKQQLSLKMGRDKTRELLEKVIKKDLECGINIKLINKSGIIHIEEFGIMLAKPCEYLDKFLENNEKFYCNMKYDGVRVVTKVKDGSITFYSRNGKIYDNFEYLKPYIKQSLGEITEITLDGEVTHNDFQQLMTITKRKDNNGIDFSGLTYNIFDIISESPLTQQDRVSLLESIINENEHVKLVKYKLLSPIQVPTHLELALEKGYEGLVLKTITGLYEYGKSTEWVKVKKMDNYDATIINLLEGEGKYKNMLGKFEIGLENGKTQFCGSGLTDEDRKIFWQEKDSLIGKCVELKYQEMTKDGLLRFPIFIRIRDDK